MVTKNLINVRILLILSISLCWGEVVADERVALVIGNGAYQVQSLNNPVNDANDISKTLDDLGFEVRLVLDENQENMEKEIQAFGKKLQHNTAGLFYYSGHAVQYDGSNYLIPIGAMSSVSAPEHLRHKTVNVGYVLGVMKQAGNRLNIVILDACRNNPFKSFSRGMDKGLTRIPSAEGVIIAYATSPGKVALDGSGSKNSPYTDQLIKMMKKPNLPIELMFKQVREGVKLKTNGMQLPWYEASLDGDFYFNRQPNVDQKPAAVTMAVDVSPNSDSQTSISKDESEEGEKRTMVTVFIIFDLGVLATILMFILTRSKTVQCKICGNKTKNKDTFKCRICGRSELCSNYCFDAKGRQCIECAAKKIPAGIEMAPQTNDFIKLKNSLSGFQIRVWSEHEGNAARTRDIEVVPKNEFSQYAIGESITLYFQSTEDCYVYFFNLGPTGNLTQLLPNKLTMDNFVKRGVCYKFPDKKAGFKWVLKKPIGTEVIKVFATLIPVDISIISETGSLFSKIETRDIVTMATSFHDLSAEQWAEASCNIIVRG